MKIVIWEEFESTIAVTDSIEPHCTTGALYIRLQRRGLFMYRSAGRLNVWNLWIKEKKQLSWRSVTMSRLGPQ